MIETDVTGTLETVGLTPESDPRSQAVVPGMFSTEYSISKIATLGPLILAAGALVLVGLGRLTFDQLLAVLGIVLGPSFVSGFVSRGYTADRTALKKDVANSAAKVAVAEAQRSVNGGTP